MVVSDSEELLLDKDSLEIVLNVDSGELVGCVQSLLIEDAEDCIDDVLAVESAVEGV